MVRVRRPWGALSEREFRLLFAGERADAALVQVGIVGPAVGGALVSFGSPGTALAVDAATFAVSACSLAALRLPRKVRETARASTLSELREGWNEVRSRTWLWVMIVYFGVFNIAAFPA